MANKTPIGKHDTREMLVDVGTMGSGFTIHAPLVAAKSVDASGVALTNYRAAVALTRTNDTNAYGAGDILGAATGSTAALTFANMAPAGGGHVLLTSATLLIESSGVISGETSYTLHLYSATPPSASGDNAAWDLPSGDRSVYLGAFSLGTPADVGSTLFVRTDQINAHIVATSANLYGYLVTVGPYTPTASRVYNVILRAIGM